MSAARDWAALPPDILLNVFLRLGPREVMLGAEQACKPWLSVAVEEPTLWRRVGLDEKDYSDKRRWRRSIYDVEEDTRLAAVDRSKGQCEAFDGFCNDYDLLDLVRRAPSLKSLSIEHYYDEESHSIKHLVKPLKKLTLLEDLQIRFTYGNLQDENKLRSVCKACPLLKKLVVMFAWAGDFYCNEDEFDMEPVHGAIPVMRKLHTLELYDCDLTCEGLEGILDNCPLLETLHIHGHFDKCQMDKELKLKCSRVNNLTLDTKKPYDYGYGSAGSSYVSAEDSSQISSEEEDND